MRPLFMLEMLHCSLGVVRRKHGTTPFKNSHGIEQRELFATGKKEQFPTPPVPNLELAVFLRTLKAEKMTEHENPAYRENIDDDSLSDDDYNCKRIRECRIGVMGASGVGKTSLTRVQYGNDILFSDLLGKRTEASLSNTFMIDIVDSDNSEHCIQTSQGFVIMYSITDRESFYEAADIFTAIERARGGKVPIVLVGSKSDQHRKRRVTAFEGQTLARHMGCPFIEISARNNDCVNEGEKRTRGKRLGVPRAHENCGATPVDVLFINLSTIFICCHNVV
ncbi:GTP-binding domain protein [Teladorsagia circumcincta]|uniref:GTP-binding domain protein n=1 Tax=Teladorsagia circumcincta TaxID=45464 RepID=A0A2G9UAK8_TELCI|nr:GTP-binding domain protein [Teladorsagia circumcincta]